VIRSAKIDETAKTLTLVVDLETPTPSATGKTLLVASTRGNVALDVSIQGKPLTVGLNAYIKR